MSTRNFALIIGIVYLALGVSGFIPGLVDPLHPQHPPVNPEGGLLFGLFPVNAIHNAVHILFGIWGLAASRSLGGAISYARAVAVIFALFTIAGLVPGFETMFGFVPLYQNDLWLHALLALIAAYFGWAHRNPTAP